MIFRIKHFRFIFLVTVALTLLFSSCQRSNIDPFDPAYDLGLVPADPTDLVNGSTNLPNYYTGTLPLTYSLNMPPAGNQQKQGSCIAWSAGYAVMSYYINRTNNGNYGTNNIGSPKFLYNLCKISDCASGSYYPRALAILKDKGICTWSDMPYNDYECTLIPNSSQYASASRYKIRSWSYLSITQTDKIKRLVYSGYPIMIAIKAYTNLFSYKSGLYNTMSGSNHGGHAVVITGYDDYLQAYKIQNSWGNNWGSNGFMWVGYNFLAQQLTLEPRCYLIVPDF